MILRLPWDATQEPQGDKPAPQTLDVVLTKRQILDAGVGSIAFETGGAGRGVNFVSPRALASLLSAYALDLRCVVYNACFSMASAEQALAVGVPLSVCCRGRMSDASALHFSTGFYEALSAGSCVERAYVEGSNRVACHSRRLALDNGGPVVPAVDDVVLVRAGGQMMVAPAALRHHHMVVAENSQLSAENDELTALIRQGVKMLEDKDKEIEALRAAVARLEAAQRQLGSADKGSARPASSKAGKASAAAAVGKPAGAAAGGAPAAAAAGLPSKLAKHKRAAARAAALRMAAIAAAEKLAREEAEAATAAAAAAAAAAAPGPAATVTATGTASAAVALAEEQVTRRRSRSKPGDASMRPGSAGPVTAGKPAPAPAHAHAPSPAPAPAPAPALALALASTRVALSPQRSPRRFAGGSHLWDEPTALVASPLVNAPNGVGSAPTSPRDGRGEHDTASNSASFAGPARRRASVGAPGGGGGGGSSAALLRPVLPAAEAPGEAPHPSSDALHQLRAFGSSVPRFSNWPATDPSRYESSKTSGSVPVLPGPRPHASTARF